MSKQKFEMEVGKAVFIIILYVSFLHCSAKKSPITGGISRIDPEDLRQYPDLIKGVKSFLDKLNAKSTAGTVHKLVCASVQASSQVVQGVLYRVAFNTGQVDKGVAQGESCINRGDFVEQGEGKFICISIWERPWLNDMSPEIKENKEGKDVESCLGVSN